MSSCLNSFLKVIPAMVNPGVNIIARGGNRSCSNSADNEDPTCNKSSSQQLNPSGVTHQQGLSSKLEEVKQAIRRESSRFKGEMEVRILLTNSLLLMYGMQMVGQLVDGKAHKLAVLHERAFKEAILFSFEDIVTSTLPR